MDWLMLSKAWTKQLLELFIISRISLRSSLSSFASFKRRASRCDADKRRSRCFLLSSISAATWYLNFFFCLSCLALDSPVVSSGSSLLMLPPRLDSSSSIFKLGGSVNLPSSPSLSLLSPSAWLVLTELVSIPHDSSFVLGQPPQSCFSLSKCS